MSLVIGGLSVRLVFNNPTLAVNTATLLLRTYTTSRGTIATLAKVSDEGTSEETVVNYDDNQSLVR
jgi:hypothetical protein